MLKSYWRHYTTRFQLSLLILLFFVINFFIQIVLSVVFQKLGYLNPADLSNINNLSPISKINAFMLFQAISSISSFAGVAFLFSYFVHPQPIDYIKYKPSNTTLYYCLVPIIIIAAIPFVQHINTLISQIPMGTSIRLYEEKMDELFKGLMQMHNGLDLVVRLFVLAIVPAICEEYFFRGVLLRLLLQIVGHPGKAILLSSLAFALIHMEPHAFLSLCLSGIMLGYIYLWTGSLRYSIFAHALFNGIQIMIEYMAQMQNLAPIEQLPAIITITAILLFIASFYFLFKHKIEAPENWLNNFRDEPNNI